jgi:hypothetical protein
MPSGENGYCEGFHTTSQSLAALPDVGPDNQAVSIGILVAPWLNGIVCLGLQAGNGNQGETNVRRTGKRHEFG